MVNYLDNPLDNINKSSKILTQKSHFICECSLQSTRWFDRYRNAKI